MRDAMLAVSGKLNPQVGGPSFRPFTVTVFNSSFYTLTDPPEPDYNRRTLYRINVNSAKSPLLEAFDCPDPSTKTPRRAVTTTPLQALTLMNNSFVLRQAQAFGERVQKEAGDDPEAQVRRAYLLAFGRPPTKEETDRAAAAGPRAGAGNPRAGCCSTPASSCMFDERGAGVSVTPLSTRNAETRTMNSLTGVGWTCLNVFRAHDYLLTWGWASAIAGSGGLHHATRTCPGR